jgi:hypothetical protein
VINRKLLNIQMILQLITLPQWSASNVILNQWFQLQNF